jgi:acetyl-CoA carboxylase biotin carboxyl carrier protein
MSAQTQEQAAEQSLESLCKQAQVLATGLPGALARLTVMAGPNRVEMEWQPAAAGAAGDDGSVPSPQAEPEATDYVIVAPLVGTFYRATEPDAAPFVTEGDIVEAGQQVAIVEAMKILNAVQTERSGRVTKFLAGNGDMVEFGQPLLTIDQADV